MQKRNSIWYLTAAVAVLLTGCGDEGYDLAPVSGVVTLDGKPLTTGVVQFQPLGGDAANPGPGSAGVLDAEGRFELQTQTSPRAEGAVIGTHQVRIYSRNAEGPPPSTDTDTGSVELVPAKYNFRTTLTYPVPPEGTDQANFDLMTE
jgi:hypothetical protein